MARLQAAGIAVELAPDEITARARELNIGFLRRMQQGLPWVRLKTASSLDGRVALDNGDSQWIHRQGGACRGAARRARAAPCSPAIGTVLADHPLLNVRLPEATRQPHLVIVDTQLRTPLSAQLLQVAQRRVLIASVAQADTGWQQRAAALQQAGQSCCSCRPIPLAVPIWVALLRELGRQEVNELHVESGAQLAGALLQQGLVNELVA